MRIDVKKKPTTANDVTHTLSDWTRGLRAGGNKFDGYSQRLPYGARKALRRLRLTERMP